MEETNKIPQIYPAMAGIMKDVKAIDKSEKNQRLNFNYRSIDNVMNELHDVFGKHEVIILPNILSYEVREMRTSDGKLMYFTRATIEWKFICCTDGSFLVAKNVGEAMDSSDKSMNKAMSIALKYVLMQMLLIPTKEQKDPDASTPEPTRNPTISEMYNQLPDTGSELGQLLLDLCTCATIEDISEILKTNVQYQAQEYRRYFTMRKNEINQGVNIPKDRKTA